MAVEVTVLSGGGGSLPVLNFQDSFQRPDEPFYLGNNWNSIITSSSNDTGLALANQINVNGTGAFFGSGSLVNNNQLFAIFIPAIINLPFVRLYSTTRGLFVQVQFISRVGGVDCNPGLALLCEPNSEQGYFWSIDSTTGNVILRRNMATAVTDLVNPVFTLAANDVLRCELTVDPVTTFVTLKTFQNGVLVNTFVDNAVQRITRPGAYGMNLVGVDNGVVQFRNFAGGVL